MRNNARSVNSSLLLAILDQGFKRKAWHGPNLRQALRGVSAKEAAWRPARGRHNIWEIALHAAYWKYVVRRRLIGGKRGSFVLAGSNWFERPGPDATGKDEAWRRDLALLENEHRLLRDAVVRYLAGQNHRALLAQIFGVAFHDVYHAGQIRLLRRVQSKTPRLA